MTSSNHEIAEQLAAALVSGDADLLLSLLDPAVRWGGEEDTEQTCRSSSDVLAWYRQLHKAGVRAQVTDIVVREQAVVLTLAMSGRESGPDGPRRDVVHQVFHLDAGLVVDIRGYPEREMALVWADTPVIRS